MAIKNRNRAIVEKIGYEKNSQKLLHIPQDNLIRRISLHGKITLTSGSTAGSGIKNHKLLGLVKRIQIRLNGHDSIIDVDAQSYFHALKFEYGAKPFIDALTVPSATKSKTFEFELPIDFALIRNQISDYTALLPAQLLDSVDLIIEWGDIGDIITTVSDTTVSTASEISVSLIEVYSNTNSGELDDIINNLTKVYEGVEQTEIDKGYQSYPADELPIAIRPVPARHLASLIFGLDNITDGNPSYSNAVVKQLKLENVKGGGESIFHDYFNVLNHQQKSDFRLESDNSNGMIYLDWTDLRNGSLDNVDVDALKFKLLTKAPESGHKNACRIYKRYIPVG